MVCGSRGSSLSIRVCASASVLFLTAALAGCGGGSGSGTGSTGGSGGSGGGPTFQPRPFPGDFFVIPPAGENGATFPGNVVYDPNLKEFFLSNPVMNEVEAYSTVDGHRVGAVTIPGPMGLSLSPDNTKLAVGTDTRYVYFVDPAALHVTGQVSVPAAVLDPSTGMEPVLPFLMASGPMLIEAAYTLPAGEGVLLSYDPVSGNFGQVNPPGATADIYGSSPARSLDGNYLAVPTLGQTALEMAVYSAASQAYIGFTPGQSNIQSVAANPDGSQFATVGSPTGTAGGQAVTFWNRSLQQQAQYATQDTNAVYSRDGKYLYLRDPQDVLAVNTQTGVAAGYQGLTLATNQVGYLWDTDETNRVYGTSDLGAFVASAAQLQSTAPLMPHFSEDSLGESIGNPNEGPLSGGTQVQFFSDIIGAGSADGIGSADEAYFGTTPATQDAIAVYASASDGGNAITATAPAATSNGPVTVVITDASNNAALLPGAYSYGPHAHWIDPSAVPPTGESYGTLWADGILSLQPGYGVIPSVTVGGAIAPTTPLDIVGTDTWREVRVSVPAGSPGWADLKMTLPDGTTETTKNMVQYLTQYASLTTAAYTSAVYDSLRDRFYLTGADATVAVFSPGTQTLLQPMQSSTASAGAVLGSLAITPDNSKLLATDPADHSVVIFDLTSGTSSAVNVLLPSDGATPVTSPMPVATLTGNQAMVLLSGWAQNQVREIDLAQMTVRVRTDLSSGGPFQVTPTTIASSLDGSMALLGGSNAGYNAPFFAWRYDASSDTFSGPVSLNSVQGDPVAVNSDGTILSIGAFALDQNLLPWVPYPFVGYMNRLTGSGGLRYSALQQVEVSDTRNGRSLLTMPSLPDWATALAVDPSGRKILACAGASLNYYELSVVPLAVSTVSPAAAAPGALLTIRGNGFVAGTTVAIAAHSSSCTMVDDQTLQCTVPGVNAGLAPMTLNNPDGQTYLLEGAVNVQ